MNNIFYCLIFHFFLINFPLQSHEEARQLFDSSSFHLNSVELKHNIPSGLLSAISKVETGRYHKIRKQVISWPWVIHAEGQGQFFSSKQEAIEAVKKLRKRGVKNIDVGLMQINLHYHPDAFSSLEQAFDPRSNIEYAAKFLKNLKEEHASWSKAVAHYHSALPEHHIPYREKVFKTWQQDKKNMLSFWQGRPTSFEREIQDKQPPFKILRMHPSRPAIRPLPRGPVAYETHPAKYQRKFNPSFRPHILRLDKPSPSIPKNMKVNSPKNRFRLINFKN